MSTFSGKIIKLTAKGFNGLRRTFFKDDATCHLIKAIGQTGEYESVLEITSAWFLTFGKFRFAYGVTQDLFEFAIDTPEFKEAIGEASHIAFRSVVYKIDPNRRSTDVLEGEGFDPWWFVYATIEAGAIFTP